MPLAGTIGAAYLEARGCRLPPEDGDLRFHSSLYHAPSEARGPALVALVTDAETCKPISVHRTWINADGTKAKDPPRMLAAGHRKSGGVIRLWPDDCVTYGLALAEGIETALAVAHHHSPIWATVDAGNMATLPALPGIEALTLYADRDPHGKGLEAARSCAKRWAAEGAEAVVRPPPEHGDWNDWGVARA